MALRVPFLLAYRPVRKNIVHLLPSPSIAEPSNIGPLHLLLKQETIYHVTHPAASGPCINIATLSPTPPHQHPPPNHLQPISLLLIILPTIPKNIYFFNTPTPHHTTHPSPNTVLIDVREPAELQSTGHIPHAQNVPLTSSPDAVFLSAEEFEDRFGFPRPGPDDEVIFYCKSGVRSKAAAGLAGQAGFGGAVSEYPGSWLDWEKNGGEKVGGTT